jgi:hypothetical protein
MNKLLNSMAAKAATAMDTADGKKNSRKKRGLSVDTKKGKKGQK